MTNSKRFKKKTKQGEIDKIYHIYDYGVLYEYIKYLKMKHPSEKFYDYLIEI